MDGSPPGSSISGILLARIWSGLPCPSPGHLLTQGFNPQRLCLLHCRQVLYPLSHQGKNYDHPQNVPPRGFFSLGNFTRFGQWPHLYNEQMESGLFPSGPSLKHAHLNGLVLGFFGGLRESSANMETQLLS